MRSISRGGALSPIRYICPRSPTGRGKGLKIPSVWVRIPLWVPFILRASVAVARRSLKPLWLGSNPRPSAIKTHTAIYLRNNLLNCTYLKSASSLFIWVGGVHGWRAGLKNRERWFDSTSAHHMGIGLWELSGKQGPPKLGSIPSVSTITKDSYSNFFSWIKPLI